MNINFIFNLGLVMPSIKKANLWGNEKYPITILSFFFFTIIVFKTSVLIEFFKACQDSANIDDVWVRLAPSIRIARKKAEAKAKANAYNDVKSDLKYWKDSRDRELELRSKYFQQLCDAEASIKTLTRMIAELEKGKDINEVTA